MTSKLSKELSGLLADIHKAASFTPEEGMSLPPEAFTSAELLALERENIFNKEWICVGRVDELSSSGDYFTADVNQIPVIILLDENNEIRSLVNICRHRMATVASGRGKTRVFTCPYHAWSYDLKGKLVNAPRMRNNRFDKTDCRLPELRLEVWQGFIYVNLDPGAEPLAPRLRPLTEHIQRFHVEKMTSVWRKQFTWRTNWKVLVENFLEVYHIPTVHKETLLPYGGYDLVKQVEPGVGYSFYLQGQETGTDLYSDIISPDVLIENPALTDFERFNTFVGCIFPSQLISISWFGVLWLVLHPISPSEIRVDWGAIGPVRGLPINAEKYSEYSFPEWIDLVNNEDKSRVEAVQRGAESGYAQAGPLHASHERTIFEFICYLSRRLDDS